MNVFLAFVSTWAHEIPKLPLMRLLNITTFSKGNPEIALNGAPIKCDYEFALIEIQNQSSVTEDRRRTRYQRRRRRSRRTATREEEEETVLIPRSFLLHSSFEDAIKGIHSFSNFLLHSFGVLTCHSFEC